MSEVYFGSIVMLICFYNIPFPEVFYIRSVNLHLPQNFIIVVNSVQSLYTWIGKQNTVYLKIKQFNVTIILNFIILRMCLILINITNPNEIAMKLQHQLGNLHWNLKSSVKRYYFTDLYCNQQFIE